MALQYTYFIEQEDLIREPVIRVYASESYPSREKRAEDRERYPSMYKIFNNKPSFGDAGVRDMSQTPPPLPPQDQVCISPRAHEKAKFLVVPESQTPVNSQLYVVTNPKAYTKTVESVKYGDTGRVSHSPRSPQNKVVTYPKALLPESTVESVKYEDVGRVSQRVLSPRTHVPHDKAKFVGRREEEKKEGVVGEEDCIDAAAAGFIEWKKRTLQMCALGVDPMMD